MTFFNCRSKVFCPGTAIIVSIIVGVVAAVLQALGIILVTPVFLWSVLGAAVAYLAALLISYAITNNGRECGGAALLSTLVGILGSILFAGLLLSAVTPITPLGIIFVGVLLFFVSLTLTSAACIVKCFANGNK